MPVHPAALLSAVAYLCLCLGAARACARETGRVSAACLLALPAFACMPLGGLPALVPVAWAGLALPACLLASRIAQGEGEPPAALICPAAALGIAALYARGRGLPGDLLSLDSYAAMPLFSLAEGRETAGLLLLAAGVLAAFREARRGKNGASGDAAGNSLKTNLKNGICQAARRTLTTNTENGARKGAPAPGDAARLLRRWACAGMWVCLFAPQGIAYPLGPAPVPGLAADALFFWAKLLCLDQALRLSALYPPRMPRPALIIAALFAAGAALLLAET